jgi:NADH dehydrogenase [ubiquinone] 1 alpha subcomplex assembly factor 5
MLLFQLARHTHRSTRHTRVLAAHSATSLPQNPHGLGHYEIFDRSAKQLQKDRAAALDSGTRSRTVDYVRDEVADRMMERLLVGVVFACLI